MIVIIYYIIIDLRHGARRPSNLEEPVVPLVLFINMLLIYVY